MHHIVYLSSAVEEMSEQALKRLLLHSRRRNRERGITGLLLYSDGGILQVLEGEKKEVVALFEEISRDCRHTSIQKLADGSIRRRTFPDWSMGFLTAAPQEFARLSGYCNPASPGFLAVRPAGMEGTFFELLREFAADKEMSL